MGWRVNCYTLPSASRGSSPLAPRPNEVINATTRRRRRLAIFCQLTESHWLAQFCHAKHVRPFTQPTHKDLIKLQWWPILTSSCYLLQFRAPTTLYTETRVTSSFSSFSLDPVTKNTLPPIHLLKTFKVTEPFTTTRTSPEADPQLL